MLGFEWAGCGPEAMLTEPSCLKYMLRQWPVALQGRVGMQKLVVSFNSMKSSFKSCDLVITVMTMIIISLHPSTSTSPLVWVAWGLASWFVGGDWGAGSNVGGENMEL
jgi:hypothetical protein